MKKFINGHPNIILKSRAARIILHIVSFIEGYEKWPRAKAGIMREFK